MQDSAELYDVDAEDEDHDGDQERRRDHQVLPLHRVQGAQPARSRPGGRE